MPSCPEQGGQWESLRFLADALRKCPRHPLLWEQVYTGCLLRASEPLSKGQSGPGLAPVAGSPAPAPQQLGGAGTWASHLGTPISVAPVTSGTGV